MGVMQDKKEKQLSFSFFSLQPIFLYQNGYCIERKGILKKCMIFIKFGIEICILLSALIRMA